LIKSELGLRHANQERANSAVDRRSLLARPAIFTGAVCVGSFSLAGYLRNKKDNETGRKHPNNETGVLASIIGINTFITLAWKKSMSTANAMDTAHTVLKKYFLHHPFSGRSLPLLLCTFSHATWTHLAFNMFALWSFGGIMLPALGSHFFMAAYASAGVLTSFSSLCLSVVRRSAKPSLGASGVLFAFAGITAAAFPEMRFSLIALEPLAWLLQLPSSDFAVPAPVALGGLMLLDCAGLVFRWSYFDHAAHLAGALVGVAYVKFGVHNAAVAAWQSKPEPAGEV
jgi:rhomboid-like protein